MRNRIILMVMLALCLTSVAICIAKHSVLVPYSNFNVAEDSKVTIYIPKEYKAAWKADIFVDVHFYNSTRRAIISLMSNVSGSQEELRLFLYADNNIDVVYINPSASAITLKSAAKWYNNSLTDQPEVRVQVSTKDITVYVVNATTLKLDANPLISKFPASFPIGCVKAWGFDAGQSGTQCDSGYVSLVFDAEIIKDFTDTIIENIVPIMILALTLGVLGKLLEKMAKKT